MRVRISLAICAAAVALAGCAGASPKPPPHPAPVSTATPAADPVSTTVSAPVSPGIAPSHADKVVCKAFVKTTGTEKGSKEFMAWLTFGAGGHFANEASNVLIHDIVTWYDDAFMSFGHRVNLENDYLAVYQNCASIGVNVGS